MKKILLIDNDRSLADKLDFEYKDSIEWIPRYNAASVTVQDQKQHFDFVLLDLVLDEKAEPLVPDGLLLVPTLEQLFVKVPIILITGHELNDELKTYLRKAYGFEAIISKPFDGNSPNNGRFGRLLNNEES